MYCKVIHWGNILIFMRCVIFLTILLHWLKLVKTAEFLQGANVDQADANGNSLLNMACWRGFADIAQLLLNNGADVDSQNESGNTPLNVCAYKDYPSVAKVCFDSAIPCRDSYVHAILPTIFFFFFFFLGGGGVKCLYISNLASRYPEPNRHDC